MPSPLDGGPERKLNTRTIKHGWVSEPPLSPPSFPSDWFLIIQFGNVINGFQVDAPGVRTGNFSHAGSDYGVNPIEVNRCAVATYPALGSSSPQ